MPTVSPRPAPRPRMSENVLSRRLMLTGVLGTAGATLAGCAQSSGTAQGAEETQADSGPTTSAFASPTVAAARAVEAGDRAVVAVTAATMWLEPGLDRAGMDEPSMSRPVDLDAWNRNMSAFASRRWLLGKLNSQALVGSPVEVDEVRDGWAKAVFLEQPGKHQDERGMIGWIPAAQLVVDERFSHRMQEQDTAAVTADHATVTAGPGGGEALLAVAFETRLPLLEEKDGHVRVALPDAEDGWLPARDVQIRRRGRKRPQPTAEQIIETGRRFLGLPYLWAGTSSYGFDCSGFTYTIFRHHGIDLPRDSGPQMRDSGFPAVDREDLQPGDLLFFAFETGGDRIRHVALYLGEDRIMHSPATGKTVEITTLTAYDPQGDYAGAVRPPLATA